MTELLLLIGISPVDLFVIVQLATLICIGINIRMIYKRRNKSDELKGVGDESKQ